jgi:hypothetical protein
MLERAILVRAMLLALLASACAGITLVFLPNLPWTGQVAATAGIVVVACGLLLAQGPWRAEGDRLTMAQRLWVTYITVPAVVAIALVWIAPRRGSPLDPLVLGLFTWVSYGLPSFLMALPALRARGGDDNEGRLNRTARRILAGCAGTGFLVAMVGHQLAGMGADQGALFVFWLYLVLMLHAGLGAAAAMALPSASPGGARTRGERGIAIAGLAASAASFVAWELVLAQIFGNAPVGAIGARLADPSQPLLTAAVALSSVAVTTALWCPLQAMRLVGWPRAVQVLATAITGTLGAMATFGVAGWAVQVFGDELVGRIVFALVILDACTLIAVAVAVRVSRRGRGSAAFLQPVESMRVRCPRCQAGAELRPGENACASCGLAIVIGFRDDRCPACEYDLRTVGAGAACPECGRARQMA